jgi:hypothetical protein
MMTSSGSPMSSSLGLASGQRSLGPCAEAMGVNTGVAFWTAVLQLPVMVALALHLPAPSLDYFQTTIRTLYDRSVNQTVIAAPNETAVLVSGYVHGMSLTGLFLISAASYTFFVVLTMNLLERNASSSDGSSQLTSLGRRSMAIMWSEEEFVSHNIKLVADPSFRMWNQVSGTQ